MHNKKFITAGEKLDNASKVLIMIHGRGGSAEDILSVSKHLNLNEFTLLAPQATGHPWYPYSFLAPPQENEPWLSSALQLLKDMVSDLKGKGIPEKDIYF